MEKTVRLINFGSYLEGLAGNQNDQQQEEDLALLRTKLQQQGAEMSITVIVPTQDEEEWQCQMD